MNYAKIEKIDSANGPGVRTSLFVCGCPRRCFNCFNSDILDYNAGEPFTEKQEQEILDNLKPSFIDGITLLGGDPLAHPNVPALLPLLRKIKEQYPTKSVWAYTGDVVESLLEDAKTNKDLEEFLSLIDVLVDGPFIEEEKDLSYEHRFTGSRNQRILDMKKTIETETPVLFEMEKRPVLS